ncbi:TPA: hypothetical protein HA361_01520 [Candidatus Woesearchaeota archaeon]|nr:hypothetical protein [Candidatus Woesearchaeota archaeon]HII68966.1 hypothetical protein [Candidatus Woesearchaeota archaeon]
MTTTIYVPDIECDSCVRLIGRRLAGKGITGYTITGDILLLEDSEKANDVIKEIKSLGFRASTSPFDRKSFKERFRDFRENKEKYQTEREGIETALGVFGLLAAITIVAYVGFLNRIPNFLHNYGWWLFYLLIAITAIGAALWHYTAYRAKFTCMVGMMVGMTFGMQTGMMLGAIIGATNGFFIGSMIGMLIGTAAGVVTGKCCGVMGIMEGMMAGVMGGTMGPMISVMMFSDHLLWFMPFFMLINIVIIIGLSYLLFEEVVEQNKEIIRKPADFLTVASLSIIAAFLLGALMLYGPTSALLTF